MSTLRAALFPLQDTILNCYRKMTFRYFLKVSLKKDAVKNWQKKKKVVPELTRK